MTEDIKNKIELTENDFQTDDGLIDPSTKDFLRTKNDVSIKFGLNSLCQKSQHELLDFLSSSMHSDSTLTLDFVDIDSFLSFDSISIKSSLDLVYGDRSSRASSRKSLASSIEIKTLFGKRGWTILRECTSRLCTSLSFKRVDESNLPKNPNESKHETLSRGYASKSSVLRTAIRMTIGFCNTFIPFRGRSVNLGCGRYPLPFFTNVDSRNMPWVDCVVDINEFLDYSDDHSLQRVHLSHILEHFTPCESDKILDKLFRKIKPGGSLRIGVPDLGCFDSKISNALSDVNKRKLIRSLLFGGQGYSGNYHFQVYVESSLQDLLERHGFTDHRRLTHFSSWPFWDSCDIASFEGIPMSLNLISKKSVTVDTAR